MDVYTGLMEAMNSEYELVRRLREGERGSVSVVRHARSGRRYILRLFPGRGDGCRRLLSLSCPHLPLIYEVCEHGGSTAVLEEYVQGDTLSYILECGPLPAREARDIALQLCRALWALHSVGAVHRDIKPGNVIMCGDEAVLVDFDALRVYKCGQDGDTRALGTVGYAAPEQYGICQSDPRSDIYSLGVLLNVMLTGRHPSQAPAGGSLGRVVQRCTMTNPRKRYRDVLRLMEALS